MKDTKNKVAHLLKHRHRPSGVVSSVLLAKHLDCARSYVGKLETENVIQREPGGGYDLDRCRTSYIRHLRRERPRSPRSAAEAEFTAAKARLLRLRIAEKEGALMQTDEAISIVSEIIGLFRAELSSLPAQCSREPPIRRAVESAVHALLHRVSDEAQRRASGFGSPAGAPNPENGDV